MSARKDRSGLLGRVARRIRWASLRLTDPQARDVIGRVQAEGLSYLDRDALVDLHLRVREAEHAHVPGAIVEAGCARGGSALVLAAAKDRNRSLRVYDVFGMIPPPSPEDGPDVHARYDVIASGGAGDDYYGYEQDLRRSVAESFDRFGLSIADHDVELIEGRYEDSLQVEGPVALAHIDCDWYRSVRVCLERIAPHLSSGGVLVIDDYDAWSGARRAIDEYFVGDRRSSYEFQRLTRLHIVRR